MNIRCPECEKDKDVHTEHCCEVHGCKYGYDMHPDAEKTCTVVSGEKKQSYPCEMCGEGTAGNIIHAHKQTIEFLQQEIKRLEKI